MNSTQALVGNSVSIKLEENAFIRYLHINALSYNNTGDKPHVLSEQLSPIPEHQGSDKIRHIFKRLQYVP